VNVKHWVEWQLAEQYEQ